jgi:hypothetical protein
MKASQMRVSQSYRGAEGWIDAHPTLVPPEAAGQVEALKGVNQRLAQYVIDQEHQGRAAIGGTATVQQLRRELRQHYLLPIAAIARTVVKITPELEVALRVPRQDAADEKVLASANAIAKIGEEHKDVLVQHGLSATVVDELQAQAAALKAALDARRQTKSGRVGATKAIGEELKTGRLVVQALDIVITRALRGQPGPLAEWKNAKRATVKPVHPAVAPAATATSPAAAAPSSEQKAA